METNMQIADDFITDYAKGILVELGAKIDDSEQSARLINAITSRVMARVFLEMIMLLTPEQAAELNKGGEEGAEDPELVLAKLRDSIPDFPVRVAQLLTTIRAELLEELKVLVV